MKDKKRNHNMGELINDEIKEKGFLFEIEKDGRKFSIYYDVQNKFLADYINSSSLINNLKNSFQSFIISTINDFLNNMGLLELKKVNFLVRFDNGSIAAYHGIFSNSEVNFSINAKRASECLNGNTIRHELAHGADYEVCERHRLTLENLLKSNNGYKGSKAYNLIKFMLKIRTEGYARLIQRKKKNIIEKDVLKLVQEELLTHVMENGNIEDYYKYGYYMCLIITLAIAKKHKKDKNIAIETTKKERKEIEERNFEELIGAIANGDEDPQEKEAPTHVTFEKLSDYLEKDVDVRIDIPEEIVEKSSEIIRRKFTNSVKFVKGYETACNTLNIPEEKRVLTTKSLEKAKDSIKEELKDDIYILEKAGIPRKYLN
jgi:hypothetical protein